MNKTAGIIHQLHDFAPDIIVSGGQSGADIGGLHAAEALGIPTGGYMPKGWKTEDGPRMDWGKRFHLKESNSPSYDVRTRQNIQMADAVICIAGNFNSPGTKLTHRIATIEYGVPYFAVEFWSSTKREQYRVIDDIRTWLLRHSPAVICVAGNRESVCRGIQKFTEKFLMDVFVDNEEAIDYSLV